MRGILQHENIDAAEGARLADQELRARSRSQSNSPSPQRNSGISQSQRFAGTNHLDGSRRSTLDPTKLGSKPFAEAEYPGALGAAGQISYGSAQGLPKEVRFNDSFETERRGEA